MIASCRTVLASFVLACTACSDAALDPMPDADVVEDAGVVGAPATVDAAGDAPAADGAPEGAPHEAGTPGTLDTTIVTQIVEPEGGGKDDSGNSFTDKNYWNFCMPGAATVALYYFLPKDVTSWPAGNFKEPMNAPSTIPSAGTYWKSSDSVNGYTTKGRAYLMHLAEQVKPPSFGTAGLVDFSSYPTTGANLVDVRDVLNWEASGHAQNWSTYFYSVVYAKGLTLTKLHDDVKKTIDGGHAVVVAADTGYLPNWSRSLSHAITIVGYDDVKATFHYTDTCGVHCNGSSKAKNGGLWTIAQKTMLDAVVADGGGYVK
ncbi:MAG TPA: C39 family peptidase [Polyangiaceae bacterium]|nr:C39 family peptidase [Polyangiaceae bacterium]